MTDFSAISSAYQRRATLQRSASGKLFELLAIGRSEDVLDVGCGPGHLTRKVRELTDGLVLGADPSEGMIAEARRHRQGLDIAFLVRSAESLDVADASCDVVFCNSAFQWIRDVRRALSNLQRVLRSGGRIGVQAPARANYCPNFVQAAGALANHPQTSVTYASFRSPWFFLETAEAYRQLFEQSGFSVEACWIEDVTERCSPARALEMFDSGAATAYLNPGCYDAPLPPGYVETAHELIASAFRSQAEADGVVAVRFSRFYLLARKH